MNPADVLDKAADLIWLRGRTTGEREAPDGSLCVRGAIAAVVGDDYRKWYPVEKSVGVYLAAHPDLLADKATYWFEFIATQGYFPAWVWNDDLRPSAENDALVIDTIRRCSKELRERGE